MIDWNTITALEGGQLLRAYIPRTTGNKSGVTIAGGIDLGYYSLADCARLPGDLPERLHPYIGLTGDRARAELIGHPLSVTKAEADAIEAPKRLGIIGQLSLRYVRDAAFPFEKLPDAAQTVLASVAWQYGDPWHDCPKFWKAACARDWPAVVAELRDFGDAFPTRRRQEADYLEKHLGR
ncbi:MAG TPA: pesticin C-terminus-like muramidase [Rhizomicrobium sp.]